MQANQASGSFNTFDQQLQIMAFVSKGQQQVKVFDSYVKIDYLLAKMAFVASIDMLKADLLLRFGLLTDYSCYWVLNIKELLNKVFSLQRLI